LRTRLHFSKADAAVDDLGLRIDAEVADGDGAVAVHERQPAALMQDHVIDTGVTAGYREARQQAGESLAEPKPETVISRPVRAVTVSCGTVRSVSPPINVSDDIGILSRRNAIELRGSAASSIVTGQTLSTSREFRWISRSSKSDLDIDSAAVSSFGDIQVEVALRLRRGGFERVGLGEVRAWRARRGRVRRAQQSRLPD
jgi:hypothetical protein